MKRLHWFFKAWTLIFLIFLIWFSITSLLPKMLSTKEVTGEIRGIIFQNQIWKGKITVTGDLITLPNVHIEIESGTQIFINNNGDKNNFDLLPWHLKHGINTGPDYHGILTGEPFWDEKEKVQIHISNLIADGTKQQIIITSSSEQGSPYDVNLIKISNGEISNVNFSNYRRLEIGPDVKIINSSFETTSECAICILSGSPLISGNTFKNSKRDYLNIIGASPLIKGNKFFESEGDGILVEASKDDVIRLSKNTFQMPSRKVVKILSSEGIGDISYNNFILGDIELPCSSKLKIYNNLIKVKISFRNIGNCSGEYILGENYWEIENSQDILNARISGTSEKFKVKIPEILKSLPKGI